MLNVTAFYLPRTIARICSMLLLHKYNVLVRREHACPDPLLSDNPFLIMGVVIGRYICISINNEASWSNYQHFFSLFLLPQFVP